MIREHYWVNQILTIWWWQTHWLPLQQIFFLKCSLSFNIICHWGAEDHLERHGEWGWCWHSLARSSCSCQCLLHLPKHVNVDNFHSTYTYSPPPTPTIHQPYQLFTTHTYSPPSTPTFHHPHLLLPPTCVMLSLLRYPSPSLSVWMLKKFFSIEVEETFVRYFYLIFEWHLR